VGPYGAGMARQSPAKSEAGKATPNRWSQRVTRESNALDLEPGVFTMPAKEMAESLRRSAESSKRRKTTPFRSAMSMLVFYQNRAGRKLSADAR
jgi:hypothetical protein